MTTRRPLPIEPLVISESEARGNLLAGLFSACIIYVVLAAAALAVWWIAVALGWV